MKETNIKSKLDKACSIIEKEFAKLGTAVIVTWSKGRVGINVLEKETSKRSIRGDGYILATTIENVRSRK